MSKAQKSLLLFHQEHLLIIHDLNLPIRSDVRHHHSPHPIPTKKTKSCPRTKNRKVLHLLQCNKLKKKSCPRTKNRKVLHFLQCNKIDISKETIRYGTMFRTNTPLLQAFEKLESSSSLVTLWVDLPPQVQGARASEVKECFMVS